MVELGVAADPAAGLLERRYELGRVEQLLSRVRSGAAGGLIVVEGALGLGKTSLLAVARHRAQEHGLHCLSARGHELECEFGYGVARQLIEPYLSGLHESEREGLLRGTASLAGPVFELGWQSPAEDPFAILHGLYWLVAELAARTPLAVVIDDGHWCDAPSLRLIAYLVNRLDTLPVAVVLAARPAPGGEVGELLLKLSAARGGELLRPGPLSAESIERLVSERLTGDPDPTFLAACTRATGGNRFLLSELLSELWRDGIEPSAAATDALVSAGILDPDRPPRFSHPMILRAVYDDLTPGERSQAHRIAAQLLAAAGADPEVVGAQLLLCDPVGDHEVAAHLLAAARAAARRGAPDTGVTYLNRALQEPPDARHRVLMISELGRLELVLRPQSAAAHLEQALELSTVAVERAQLAENLADALSYTGSWDRCVPLLRAAIAELGDGERALAMRLRAVLAAIAIHDARFAELRVVMCEELDRLVREGDEEVVALLPVHALALALEGARCAEVAGLVQRAFADPRHAAVLYRQQMLVGEAGYALLFADALDVAEHFAASVAADSADRGSVAGFVTASVHRADVRLRTGRLAEAQAEGRPALELAADHGAQLPHPVLIGYLALAAVERGEDDDAVAALLALPLVNDLARTGIGLTQLDTRAQVRLARGDAPGALADLRQAADSADRLGVGNPNVCCWRSRLALMVARDAPEEASALVAEELALARRSGLGRSIGVALRAQGALEDGERQIDTLREAVSLLDSVNAPLELARALVGLCGARATRSSPASRCDVRLTSPSDPGPSPSPSALGPKRWPPARGRDALGSAASKR